MSQLYSLDPIGIYVCEIVFFQFSLSQFFYNFVWWHQLNFLLFKLFKAKLLHVFEISSSKSNLKPSLLHLQEFQRILLVFLFFHIWIINVISTRPFIEIFFSLIDVELYQLLHYYLNKFFLLVLDLLFLVFDP